jgi:hypothetical protein
VAHLTGWTAELADALYDTLASRSAGVAQLWRSWAGEVAADVHAFALAGWAPVFALSTVVDGPTGEVFRIRYGDPHPFGWIRVLFNAALCRSWYGAGPWDDVARAWWQRHPIAAADPDARLVAKVSIDAMADLVEACTRRPMRAFRGAPLAAVIDPRAVAPDRMADLQRQAGGTLLTSSYLRRRHSLQLFALLSTRAVVDPANAEAHRARLRAWLRDVGADAAGATPIDTTRAA